MNMRMRPAISSNELTPSASFMRRVGTKLVDQNLRPGMAFEILKKQRRAAAGALGIAALGHAVGDFGNFENRVGFGLDALELARAIERCDPLAEVVEGQRIPLCCDRRL